MGGLETCSVAIILILALAVFVLLRLYLRERRTARGLVLYILAERRVLDTPCKDLRIRLYKLRRRMILKVTHYGGERYLSKEDR